MIDLSAVPIVSRHTRTVHYGIELPYADVPATEYRDSQVGGTVFVSFSLLEALCDADNSWGLGGAFLVNDLKVKRALDEAGLIHIETKGGVYTDDVQRAAIHILIASNTDPEPSARDLVPVKLLDDVAAELERFRDPYTANWPHDEREFFHRPPRGTPRTVQPNPDAPTAYWDSFESRAAGMNRFRAEKLIAMVQEQLP